MPRDTFASIPTPRHLATLDSLSEEALEELREVGALTASTLAFHGKLRTTRDVVAPRFRKLRRVDLGGNCLERIGDLATLAELRELVLSGNHIDDLDDLRSCGAKLELLELQHNALRSLGEAIGRLTRLRTLRLDSQAGGGIASLAPLRTCAALTALDVSGNALTSIDGLLDLNALASLNLARNAIVTLDLGTAVGRRACFPRLVELNLRGNALTSARVLDVLASLETVDLSRNRIAEWSELPLLPRAQEVYLDHNALRDVVGGEGRDAGEAVTWGTIALLWPRVELLGLAHNELAALPVEGPCVVSIEESALRRRRSQKKVKKRPSAGAGGGVGRKPSKKGGRVRARVGVAAAIAARSSSNPSELRELWIEGNPVARSAGASDLERRLRAALPQLEVLDDRDLLEEGGGGDEAEAAPARFGEDGVSDDGEDGEASAVLENMSSWRDQLNALRSELSQLGSAQSRVDAETLAAVRGRRIAAEAEAEAEAEKLAEDDDDGHAASSKEDDYDAKVQEEKEEERASSKEEDADLDAGRTDGVERSPTTHTDDATSRAARRGVSSSSGGSKGELARRLLASPGVAALP